MTSSAFSPSSAFPRPPPQQQQQPRHPRQPPPQVPHYRRNHSTSLRPQPLPAAPLFAPLNDLINFVSRLPPLSQWPAIVFHTLITEPAVTLLERTRDFLLSPTTHRIVLRLGLLGTIFWVALAAAIISYVGFYRAWVPQIGLRKEVWLQYGLNQPPFCDLTFTDPTHQDTGLADPRRFFADDQAYDVSLEIGIPINEANLDLGNFMVSLDLRSANSQLLSVKLLRRAILQPSYHTRPLIPARPDPLADRRVTFGRVTVGRWDADKYWMYGGSGSSIDHNGQRGLFGGSNRAVIAGVGGHKSRGELQTYSASLRFDAHLTGLRFFMYHYPMASFFFFTGLFLSFELAVAVTLWALVALYTSSISPSHPSLAADEHYASDGADTKKPIKRQGSPALEPEFTSSAMTDTESETERYLDRQTKGGGEIKEEQDDERDLLRLRSLESLQARDEAERTEAMRLARLREIAEGRRMTGLDVPAGPISLSPGEDVSTSRRVLGRLDEETEEETEVVDSASGDSDSPKEREDRSANLEEPEQAWEDVGSERGDGQQDEKLAASGSQVPASERSSTVGGSATSQGSVAPSFDFESVAGQCSSRPHHSGSKKIGDSLKSGGVSLVKPVQSFAVDVQDADDDLFSRASTGP
ncbi:hypothetical protein IE53DRAFT_377784 [Violaceomyces palustris]|uniref:Uncharacterized protein n=1 Tax=Violaceomyces palustris TaxID=1673888 RepID=A0ACD0P4A0_9BASI|nr:hypothetical protein IE53DRAFT_377784 [Violaceomyces palustris]